MDRFIKTLGLLIIMLFLLAMGIDVTLEHCTGSVRVRHATLPGAEVIDLQIYRGDLNRFAVVSQAEATSLPLFLKRTTKTPGPAPVPAAGDHRWL